MARHAATNTAGYVAANEVEQQLTRPCAANAVLHVVQFFCPTLFSMPDCRVYAVCSAPYCRVTIPPCVVCLVVECTIPSYVQHTLCWGSQTTNDTNTMTPLHLKRGFSDKCSRMHEVVMLNTREYLALEPLTKKRETTFLRDLPCLSNNSSTICGILKNIPSTTK